MSIFADYDERFVGLQKKVARFIGAAMIATAIVVVVILVKQDIFASTTTLYFSTSDGTDLYEGMAVRMRGFNVGKVSKVTMEQDASIKVRLEIKNEYMHFIRAGSVFKLAGKNMFEESAISIALGPMGNVPVEANASLPLLREPGIGELANKLVQQVEPVLVEAHQAVASINDPNGDVHRLLNNANATVSKFAQAGDQFTKTGAEFTRTSEQFSALAQQSQAMIAEDKEKAGKLLDGGAQAVDQINKTLPAALSKLEASLANLEAASADLKRVTTESAATVPPMLKDSKDIIGAAKSSWPINSMMEQAQEKTLSPDSYVPKK
jgi:phospholipid/cholesterol/gamma-HCH transport system substrate-binding protein